VLDSLNRIARHVGDGHGIRARTQPASLQRVTRPSLRLRGGGRGISRRRKAGAAQSAWCDGLCYFRVLIVSPFREGDGPLGPPRRVFARRGGASVFTTGPARRPGSSGIGAGLAPVYAPRGHTPASHHAQSGPGERRLVSRRLTGRHRASSSVGLGVVAGARNRQPVLGVAVAGKSAGHDAAKASVSASHVNV
jgi:hypothetical protein